MQIHDLIQGTDAWHEFRLTHRGASEAAAMLGISKKVKRTELLRMKHTGNAKEFSDWVQENILDYGHEVEALARPIVERKSGDDLYPVTCSDGLLSASCDGLTMCERTGWEHKQWNAELAAAVVAKELPDEFMAQPQQCLMVTKAERWIFTVSDGTEENMVSMEILPDPAWFERIRAGWVQFDADLAVFVPAEVVAQAVGRTPDNLPALRVEITGEVTVSNLDAYKDHALAVFKSINRTLTTDQHFADAEKAVKWCGDVEDRLVTVKGQALSQTKTIETLFLAIDKISAEARATRLELEKLVAARKLQVRTEIQQDGIAAMAAHIAALNARLGKPYMPTVPADFAGAMKGKRTIDSLRDAVSTTLANSKIAASAIADRIQANLNYLRTTAKDHVFLFADTAQIVLKAPDDLTALVKLRISEHTAAEAKKEAEQRERIRAEIAEQERERAEHNARVQAESDRLAAKASADAIVKAEKQALDEIVAANALAQSNIETARQTEAMPAPLLDELSNVTNALAADSMAEHAIATASRKSAAPPDLKLGQIAERLGFALTADFLRTLGFEPAGRDRSAVLYHRSDFQRIGAALIDHINSVCELQAA